MRRVGIAMFIVGGFTCLSGIWTLQETPESRMLQAVISGALVTTGVVVWMVRRPGRWFLEGIALWGMTLLGVLIAGSEPLGMAPVFYLWPVVYLAYFSRARVVVVGGAWMVLMLGVALVLNETHPLKVDTFTGTVATVGVMAALVATMTRKQVQLRTELEIAAETDPLTGLMNRRSFEPLLAACIRDASERNQRVSVVMFDLDHFKALNDEHGHHVGDEALAAVAGALRATSRDGDLIARYGGEEFVAALPGASVDDARLYTERVSAALDDIDLAEDVLLSTSAGISSLTDENEGAEELLRRADEALYAAKEAGRRRSAWWDGGVQVGRSFGPEPQHA